MASYPINYNLYTFFWKKYRPVVVKLMMDAADGLQQYQFIQHEFKDINPKEKGGHTFTLEAFKGKALNNIKPSVVAQDLLITLQASGKAMELLSAATYEFVLDKQYMLHIAKVQEEEEEVEVEVEVDNLEIVEETKEAETGDAETKEEETVEDLVEEVVE